MAGDDAASHKNGPLTVPGRPHQAPTTLWRHFRVSRCVFFFCVRGKKWSKKQKMVTNLPHLPHYQAELGLLLAALGAQRRHHPKHFSFAIPRSRRA